MSDERLERLVMALIQKNKALEKRIQNLEKKIEMQDYSNRIDVLEQQYNFHTSMLKNHKEVIDIHKDCFDDYRKHIRWNEKELAWHTTLWKNYFPQQPHGKFEAKNK